MRTTLALFLLAGSLPLTAQPDVDALLRQAEEAYSNADHRSALALYDSVAADHTSAGLLFNIGNCYSKLGDVPHAILNYERALRLSPGAEDVQANLDLERAKVVDRVSQLPAFTLGSMWDRLQGGRDVDQWARRSLWACALMAAAAAGGLLVHSNAAKRGLYALALVGLVATIASTALAAYRVQQVEQHAEAIILTPSVEVRGEPREGSTRLFILHQGTKLDVLEEQGDWREVRLSSGAVGWLPKAAIAVI